MDDEVVISWTLQNWITVVLMVLVFFFVLGLASGGIRRLLRRAGSQEV